MSCSSRDIFSIELPRHDVEVLAKETDLRIRRRHYARASFQLTEEAGKVIERYHENNTLATVNVNQEVGHRMVIPQDGISFEDDLNSNTIANVDLLDARKVLSQESIEKSFKDVSAEDIVEFLLDRRHDPEGVILDHEFINPGDRNLTETTSWFFESGTEDEPPSPNFEENLDLDIDPFGLGTDIAGFFGVGEELGAYTFNFGGETILEAMQEVMNAFGLNWWVENDGTLYIGPDGTQSQLVASRSGHNEIALSRYTVTRAAKTTNAVQLHGSVLSMGDVPRYITRQRGKAPKVIAEAVDPNISGTLLIDEVSQPFDSLEDLETISSRRLYQEVMDDTSGSAEINGLASTDVAALRELNVGDYFFAGPGIEADCNEEVVIGLFMITSVQHLSDPRRGWNISIEVSRIPNPAEMQTTSVLYDPLEDKEYEDLSAYSQATAPDPDDFPSTT